MTMIDLAAVVSQVRRGMIPAHVYGDPEIFPSRATTWSAGC
jgi:hypothetical protein